MEWDYNVNATDLEQFLVFARTRTYAGSTGKVASLLPGSIQLEFGEENRLYRDVYFIGNGLFNGMETIYEGDAPIWSLSYFGDFSQMSENQADAMLKPSLLALWDTTRLYHDVSRTTGEYTYRCSGKGSLTNLSATEHILVDDRQVYSFWYAGGYIGEEPS